MWQVEKGHDGTLVARRQGRGAARCGGASQGKRAMVRHSMSAGVLLTTIRSLASSPSSTSRGQPPGALPRRQPRWSEFLLGFMRDPAAVASRFLLPWLSLDGAIRFWGDR